MKYILVLLILVISIMCFSISGCVSQINNNEFIHEIDESMIKINEYLDNVEINTISENNTIITYKLKSHCNDELSWMNTISLSSEIQNLKYEYINYLNRCINLTNHLDDYTNSKDIVYLYVSLDELSQINSIKKEYDGMKKGYYANLTANSNEIYMIDMCTAEPKNKQIWEKESIFLYKKPGEFNSEGQELVGILPTCDKIKVINIDTAEVNDNRYYEIVSGTECGWISEIIFDLFTPYNQYLSSIATPIPTIQYPSDPENSGYIIAYDQTTDYIPADMMYIITNPPIRIEYEATTNEIDWEKVVFEKVLDKPGEWITYNQTFANPDARFKLEVFDESTASIVGSKEIEFFDTTTESDELIIHTPGNFIIKMSGSCIYKLHLKISMPKENKANLPIYK